MEKIKPILCVVTSNGKKGPEGGQTGFWFSELTHPLHEFSKAGLRHVIVSISGGNPPIDNGSLAQPDSVSLSYLNDPAFMEELRHTSCIDEVDSSDYSAVLFVGGHGPLWDFPNNQSIHRIAREIFERGGIVSAVCHGPCALMNVQLSNNDYLIRNKRLVSFTNKEEVEVKSTDIVPFSLETALTNCHASFLSSPNWTDNVVVDGNLITGQNPQSAASLGKAVSVVLLSERK